MDNLLDIELMIEEMIENRMDYSVLKIPPEYMEGHILTRRPHPDGEVTFDLRDLISKKDLRRIEFKVGKFSNGTPFDLELALEDGSMFSRRVLTQNRYNRIGDRMYFGLNDIELTKEFHISIMWVDQNYFN